jgi:hypothetical protein
MGPGPRANRSILNGQVRLTLVRIQRAVVSSLSLQQQFQLVEEDKGAAPMALRIVMGIPTQPFGAGLTFSGRPSGPRWGLVPEPAVPSSTDRCG